MATYNLAVLSLMVILSCTTLTSATIYTVGDTAGWGLSVDYATWASDRTFKVGDILGEHRSISAFMYPSILCVHTHR